MNLTKIFRIAAALFVATLGFATPGHAAVTSIFFSLGANCSGAQTTAFTPGGTPVTVSLCMSGDLVGPDIASCGHTILLQAANIAESGSFTIADYTLGSSFADFNSPTKPVPMSINNPATVADFGGTILAGPPYVPVSLSTGQLLATFTLQPNAGATNASSTDIRPSRTAPSTRIPAPIPLTPARTRNPTASDAGSKNPITLIIQSSSSVPVQKEKARNTPFAHPLPYSDYMVDPPNFGARKRAAPSFQSAITQAQSIVYQTPKIYFHFLNRMGLPGLYQNTSTTP